ncbi:MAG: hypothetical protein LUF84_03115 [Clostridiales bacterium]|nr:hypothetical protein [Clostridiales bacterium]
MAEFVKLSPDTLQALREGNPMMMSYNVEFAEVTGGTFWKAYTPGQVAGTEEFYVEPSNEGIAALYKDLMQVYPPSTCTTRSSAPWPGNWGLRGCVCLAPGLPRPTMTLTAPPTARCRRAI